MPTPNVTALQRLEDLRQAREVAEKCLYKAREEQARWYNQKRKDKQFQAGDWVLLSTANLPLKRPSRKLADKFAGPYQVIRPIGTSNLAYELRLPTTMRIHNVFNITALEPYTSREGTPKTQGDHPFEEPQSYEIEGIIRHKYQGKRRLFEVKWLGYDETENSWLKRSDFDNPETVREYEKTLEGGAGSS